MKEDEMSELKPCPYCGGEDAYNVYLPDPYSRDQYAWVNCKTCNASGGQFVQRVYPDDKSFSRNEMELESAKLWNTRPIEDDLRKRIAELEKALNIDTDLTIAGLRKELRDATARIAELEAERRWRVVADGELPEVYRDEDGEFIPFLVCEGDGDRPFIAMYGGINWHAGIFVPDITHWMPLPELPEVQE